MHATQGVHTKHSKLYSFWALLALLFFIGVLGRAAYGAYNKQAMSASARISLEREISDLEARQVSMQKDVSRLQSSEGIDIELREKFQVVKPGEEMIVVKTTK